MPGLLFLLVASRENNMGIDSLCNIFPNSIVTTSKSWYACSVECIFSGSTMAATAEMDLLYLGVCRTIIVIVTAAIIVILVGFILIIRIMIILGIMVHPSSWSNLQNEVVLSIPKPKKCTAGSM